MNPTAIAFGAPFRRASAIGLGVTLGPCLSTPSLADASPAADQADVLQWANDLVQTCWSCRIMDSMIDVGLGMADTVFSAVAGEISTLLGLLMGLWTLFFAGKLFLPFESGGKCWLAVECRCEEIVSVRRRPRLPAR